MSAASNYLENKLLDHILRAITFTSPAIVYVALHTADPTDAPLSNEVSGNAYARVSVTAGFNAPSNGVTQNTNAINFPTPTGSGWGTITHASIWDASSSGNMLMSGPLSQSKSIAPGDTVRFNPGDLVVSVA